MEGLFILEVKFLCISLLPCFDLSLIVAGQAVMTGNIASIQPKQGKVMGINQIELSHLLSHALSVSTVCLPSMPPPCIWKGKRRLKSPTPQWHRPPSLLFLIHHHPSPFPHSPCSTLTFLSSSCLGLFTFSSFLVFFPLEIMQLSALFPFLLYLLLCYFSANIRILFSTPSTLLLAGTFPSLIWASGSKKRYHC